MKISRAGVLAGVLALLVACGSGDSGASAGKEQMDEEHAFTNRLIDEKSPYLLQHAHNPVNWYGWGEEALAKSREEDKPIFLSIGYSTCHWCHVMEKESFENEEIAAILNAGFVCIKVDREERPDLDNLYMTAVQAMTGSGGWPMSVFLTPDLKPFFAGTYFPPDDRYGRPGFGTLLQNISEAWRTNRPDLVAQGDKVAEFLLDQTRQTAAADAGQDLTAGLLDAAYEQVAADYDARLGGFGRAPKFPTPHKLTYLLRYAERTGNQAALDMVRGTLDAMAAGGIQDHLGGGFHRYSTDERWLAPHFEKMLYDQAGLALAYLAGWQVFGDEVYATVTRGILDYVLRDLQNADGGFYSAEDADSEGEEGTFYVWTAEEIKAVLGADDAEAFARKYGVSDAGNWEGKNILHVSKFTQEEFEAFADQRQKLFRQRERRVRPHLDDKIIVGWNGYMIEAMARAGAALGDPRYVEAAERAATFIESNLWSNGRLLRHFRHGATRVPAYLDDYAFLARGYLVLYESTFNVRWLGRALEITREMDRLFARPEGGYLLVGSDAETLLTPVVEIYDGALPSGNSVAAILLLRLGHLTANDDLKSRGWSVLETFVESMKRNPSAHLEMLSAVDFGVGPNTEVVVAGEPEDPNVNSMLRILWDRYMPNAVTAFRPAGDAASSAALIPYLEPQRALEGKATAYVCRDYACRLPVHDSEGLLQELDTK